MYHTRDPIEQLVELNENKQAIVVLLEQLDELGWSQSHWVKYLSSDEKPFIEIYGDNSYKHIKGDTIEDCYREALKRVQALKVCEHQLKYRKDSFTICEKCGQFGHATAEEMKNHFKKFSVKDENENEHFYSDEPLCEACDGCEMILFSNSRKDEIGYMCPGCKTIIEKRKTQSEMRDWVLIADPIDPDFKLKLPYREAEVRMSIHKMMSLGRESEQSILFKLNNANERLIKSANTTEKVIDPTYELSQEEQTTYLKKYVLSRKFNLVKDNQQYQLTDMDITYNSQAIEKIQLKMVKAEKEKPSDEQVLGSVFEAILAGTEEEKE